ncbi:16084_t:CDS:2 [Funneliformis caledonium]|uniref:16084_t:CDS:1 n=1 Tax=Funneliformis caledonium TaxID=1117310 RepID=A0A9N9ECV8_9GLOM|nr:16084_t:CDS:2 [Funneliformis caledonium]
MQQNLLIDSGLSSVDGDHELLKALGLINDEEVEVIDGQLLGPKQNVYQMGLFNSFWGRCLENVYQARLTHHQNIILREFTRRLSNLSEQEKNGLFDTFSRSNAFGLMEYNGLLDALADP